MNRWVLAAPFAGLALGCASVSEFRGFQTSDGITIAADLHLPERESGERAPLVVLVHQLGRDRRSWDPLVPRLQQSGFAVMALDHRGFGESRREVASPAHLTDAQKNSMHLDVVEAVPAISRHPAVDASRIAVIGSGLSATPAVRCAMEHSSVRCLVLLAGNIQIDEELFLIEHPDLPVLLVAAAGDGQGSFLMDRYGSRLTGENQRYFEFGPIDSSDAADWQGTDGLRDETGLADLIVWFLERNFAPSPPGTG
jgi:alpha-beta hydrolase superfamily lysophospholipase